MLWRSPSYAYVEAIWKETERERCQPASYFSYPCWRHQTWDLRSFLGYSNPNRYSMNTRTTKLSSTQITELWEMIKIVLSHYVLEVAYYLAIVKWNTSPAAFLTNACFILHAPTTQTSLWPSVYALLFLTSILLFKLWSLFWPLFFASLTFILLLSCFLFFLLGTHDTLCKSLPLY